MPAAAAVASIANVAVAPQGGGPPPAVRALLGPAGDPATPPARLRQIAEQAGWPRRRLDDAQMCVHDALAANPSSPPDVLARLMGHCPDALCRNPVLPLLALEDPGFFRAEPEATARLLRSPLVPAVVAGQIEHTAESEEVAEAARLHVSLAGEAGEDWPDEVRAYWRARVAAAPEADRAEYAGFTAAAASSGAGGFLEAVAGDAGLSGRFRRALSPDSKARERAEAAADPSWYVRLGAALNPMTAFSTRTYLLTRLSREAFQNDHRLAEYGRRRPETEREGALLAARAARDRVRHSAMLREMPLWTFVALSHAGPASDVPASARLTAAESHVWWHRLGAALGLRPAEGEPGQRALAAASLSRLADDGNRLARAAARSRLERPDGEFRL